MGTRYKYDNNVKQQKEATYLEERNIIVMLYRSGVVQFMSDNFFHLDFAAEK